MEINMAIDKVREYFKTYQMDDHILEFNVSSATVELAAEALQCEGKRIAKTMSFLIGDQPILIVTAGDTKIDNAKYKHFFGAKAKMILGDEVENIIKEKGWLQISDENIIEEIVVSVLDANPQSITDYKAGKDRALGFLVGQAMKQSKGKANPQMLNSRFVELINNKY